MAGMHDGSELTGCSWHSHLVIWLITNPGGLKSDIEFSENQLLNPF